jgi:cbb3-type cytochrome c oxidase subunit III
LRRIHIILGSLGALALAAAMALYMMQEPERLADAQQALLASRVTEGQPVYLENCALCHGAAGEGLSANPALATEGVAAMDYDELHKVIARGRYGTAMPAWSVAEGGPLDDAALEAVVLLLQHGDWEDTYHLAGQLDLIPRAPVAVAVPEETLAQVAALPEGPTLSPALQTYAASCVACHGSNGEGSPLAPALNDPMLRAERTAEQLAASITYGVPGTLMAGWNQHLDPAAIDGLVQLILTWDQLDPALIPTPPPAPVVEAVDVAALIAAGQPLYAQSCATCHGSDGQGTPRAPALNVQSFFARVTNDVALAQIITLGVPGTAMPPWGDRLSASEIEAIAAYIRAWEPTAPAVATPQRGRGLGPPWLRTP